MGKRLVFIFIFLLMLSSLAYLYINNVLLPLKLKYFAESRIGDFLQRPVTIEKLRFEPLKGFVISRVKIFEHDNQTTLLAEIPEVAFPILLAPILQQKNIIIASITLQSAHLNLVRDIDGNWNIHNLLNKPEIALQQEKYNILLRKVILKNGRVDIINRQAEPNDFESFYQINAEFSPRLNGTVTFKLASLISNQNQKITIKGNINPTTHNFQGHLTCSNIPLHEYLKRLKAFAPLQSGQISYADIHLAWTPLNLLINGHLTLENTIWNDESGRNFQGTANISQMNLKWSPQNLQGLAKVDIRQAEFSWTPKIQIHGALQLNLQNIFWSTERQDLNGSIDLTEIAMTLPETTITGDLNAPSFTLSRDAQRWQLVSPLKLNNIELHSKNNITFKGNLNSVQTILTWNNQTTEVTSDLVAINSELIWSPAKISWQELTTPNIHLRYTPENISLQSRMNLNHLLINSIDGISFNGQPVIEAELTKNLLTDDPSQWQGQIKFQEGLIDNVPWVQTLNNLKGIVTFQNNGLETTELQTTALNTSWNVIASLKNFLEPIISAKFHTSDLELKTAQNVLNEHGITFPADVSGLAESSITYQGTLHQPQAENFTAEGLLREATLSSPHLPKTVTNIHGSLRYAQDIIAWQNLNASYQDENYLSSGKLENFSRPRVEMNLSGNDLDIKTNFHILRRVLQFNSLQSRYRHSAANLRGETRFPENQPPWFDLRGTIEINLDEILPLLPTQFQKYLTEWGLSGTFNGNGLFRGSAKEWKDWQLTFTGQSPAFRLKDYKVEDINLKYVQRDNTISQAELTGTLYQGRINLSGQMDLRDPKLPITLNTTLNKISLSAYRQEKWPNNNLLSGSLNLEATLSGPLMNAQDLIGEGSLNLTDGYLWHKNMKQTLFGMLFIIPELKETIFTSAQAQFELHDGNFRTQNATVTGEDVSLTINGSVGLDKHYKFIVTPKLSTGLLMRTESARKLPTSILSQMVDYHCFGILGEKPECTRSTNPMRLIGNTVGGTAEMIGDGVNTFFKDVFGSE